MIILQSQATTLNNDIWLHFFYDHMQVKTKNQIEDYFEQKLIIYDNYNYSIQQLCEFDSFFICIFYRLAFFMTKKKSVDQNVVDQLLCASFFSYHFFLTKRDCESLQQTKEMKK